MNNKPIAIVLGGTSSHIDLIQELKRRGYYTVLLDYLEKPVAASFADEHLCVSTLDQHAVLGVAKSIQAQLVVNVGLDQPIATACYVAEKLHLPMPYSYDTALLVTNKALMKQRMLDVGVPTARCQVVECVEQCTEVRLDYPLVVKPADGTGSIGVLMVANNDELIASVHQALAISRTGKAIVEEFSRGQEYNVYFIVRNGMPQFLMSSKKYKLNDIGRNGFQHVGSVTSARQSAAVLKTIYDIATDIVKGFTLYNCPLLIQLIINGRDVKVVEFAARLGGGGLSYKICLMHTGMNILSAAVDSYVGCSEPSLIQPNSKSYGTSYLYADAGEFDHISGVESLLNQEIAIDFFPMKSKGTLVPAVLSSRSKLGAFLYQADAEKDLFVKISKSMQAIDIVNTNGGSMIRRNIYLREHADEL